MKKATEMDWFRHDIHAMNDLHLQKLMRRCGLKGLGAFWLSVELLYQNGNSVRKEDLADELSFYDAEDCYEQLVSLGLLVEADGYVGSKRVKDEIEFAELRREKKSLAGRKGMEARWNKANTEITGDNDVITKDNNVTKNDNDVITKDNTIPNLTKDNKYISLDSFHSLNEILSNNDSEEGIENGKTMPDKTDDDQDGQNAKSQVLIDRFKAICHSFPQPRAMSSGRKKAIDAILKSHSMEEVEEVFTKAEASDFLSGRDGKWKCCGLDWLLNSRNFCKVLEGNYDRNSDGSQKPNGERWMANDNPDDWNKYKNDDGSLKLPEGW